MVARSALVIIDMQYATGHPDGPLARKMKAEGNSVTDWRFQRINSLVIPNNQKLITAIAMTFTDILRGCLPITPGKF